MTVYQFCSMIQNFLVDYEYLRIQKGKRTYSYLIYESNINLDFELSFSTVVEKSNERKNAAQLNFAPNRICTMKNQLLLLHYL